MSIIYSFNLLIYLIYYRKQFNTQFDDVDNSTTKNVIIMFIVCLLFIVYCLG